MRICFTSTAVAGLIAVSAAQADTPPDISDLLQEKGIAGTQTHLASLAEPSPSTDMALAAVTFLRGIERAYQARWRIGENTPLGQMLGLPVLSTQLPENPAPQQMEAGFLRELAQGLIDDMTATRAALKGVDKDAALPLRPESIWFDVNANGQQDDGEALAEFMPRQFGIPVAGTGPSQDGPDAPATPAEVRFDAADAEWLRAYTHMLSGFAEFVLAFDPDTALQARLDMQGALEAQWRESFANDLSPGIFSREAAEFGPVADDIAVILDMLRHDPDPARILAARQHMRDMIAANRGFWASVAAETDNDREWIPNDNQQSALGFNLPQGTGPMWLAVLDEAEAVLDGELLIPFWRFAPGYGINLAKWFENPSALDPIGWIQGASALPYADKGNISRGDMIDQFQMMIGRDAGLYMVLLN